MLAYLIILSIAIAGMMQAHWWAAVAGGCILALLMIAERRPIVLSAVARGQFHSRRDICVDQRVSCGGSGLRRRPCIGVGWGI